MVLQKQQPQPVMFSDTKTTDSLFGLHTPGAERQKYPWFDYRRGRIVVKNPDQEILRKMWLLAQRLSAKVQGDDGETYDRKGSLADD
jgi:hypothetical protein